MTRLSATIRWRNECVCCAKVSVMIARTRGTLRLYAGAATALFRHREKSLRSHQSGYREPYGLLL